MAVLLVTGSSGFIGHSLCARLLAENPDIQIVGLDNMNDYYDVRLKEYRLADLKQHSGFTFIRGDISDKQLVMSLFDTYRFDAAVHLAAQAGVRYSLENPDVYISSNIIGFYNILEACRHYPVRHLVYASSSSVYGGNQKLPFDTGDRTDTPVSLYAATKKADELLACCYSTLYGIPATGLRLFTVYGPAGRPDMAYFCFADKLLRGEKIQLFDGGNCMRDFTYIDDIVEGILRVLDKPPMRGKGKAGTDSPPFALYNIGDGQPVRLTEFVQILAQELIRAHILPQTFQIENFIELAPMQAGDVRATWADCSGLEQDFGFTPQTRLREGLRSFAEWYGFYLKEIVKYERKEGERQ